ncbi:hypothetical protein [Pseudodesulfovibrio tunisiensis]|uniref:hypothetical protein n=1 Tax=Pseudodesulfovibrio tunisiensis TaxID=463192 RepID=UPI001FB35BAE|nr:hypothetical protein [Pseudodesulfovibrio tunisiensis]
MVDRKKEIKKWLIDHELNFVELGEVYGCSKQAAYNYLVNLKTCPPKFVELCREYGIPEHLLPYPTKPKGQLLAENKRLRRELAWCWSKLEQFGTHPGEAIR